MEQQLIPQNQVRFVYRHYAFLGQESVWAAEASECAADQGKFWPYYYALAGTAAPGGRNSGAFSKDALKRIGAEAGLEQAGFDACVDSGRTGARVQEETAAAVARGITSTPSVFVNGRKLQGVPSWDELQRAVLQAQTQR